MKYGSVLVFVLLIMGTINAFSETKLFDSNDRHYEAKQRYYNSLNNQAFEVRIKQIKELLDDFRQLTQKYLKEKYGEKYMDVYARDGIKDIKNTHWDMQYLGFDFIPTKIRGIQLRNIHEIRKLEYEIAKYKLKNGEINKMDFNKAKENFEQNAKALKDYLDKEVNYEE